jgi:hypothetical protein
VFRVDDFFLQISLHPSSLRPRSDSFADAFPFFNSKLLSNMPAEPERKDGKEAKLRPASSMSDVRALFDNTSNYTTYRHLEPQSEFRPPPGPTSGFYRAGPPSAEEYRPHVAPRPMVSLQSAFEIGGTTGLT